MTITILGSGSMLPTKERFPASFLVEHGDTKLLLDCGFGAIARLTQIDIDPRDINAVFISHFHTDHLGDAFNLVHARWVGDVYQGREHTELTFIGPETLEERFRKWREISWSEPEEHHPLTFHEGPGEYRVGEIALTIFPVEHVPWFKSVGVRLMAGDNTVVYPGDIGSTHGVERLLSYVEGADLLLIEAGYDHPTPNHFTLDQIEEIKAKGDVGRVAIIHMRAADGEEERVGTFVESREGYILPDDLMTIEL